MREQKTQEERLYPAKVAAAFASLAFMVGLFFLTLSRGYQDVYPVVLAVVTVALAVGIVGAIVRRRRGRALGRRP
ncbi:hypothetical protein [Actinophytocola gossypii]|uniref:Uncharacterized protein n=1 Tax=Actinophytocola gossypii TaxID=2812003 RepID=A0ABT2J991_9PSEU|nr:hypothetical protein [Actinophytocola gossypii]MCT2584437.1 hypothetical protein [Actinophytocola gossypii]